MTDPKYVSVIAPDGTKGKVPVENAADAIENGGFKLDEAAKYEGEGVRTFLESTARAATLGASDYLQAAGAYAGTKLGNLAADIAGYGPEGVDREGQAFAAAEETKADLLGRQEANEDAATLGKVAGGLGLGLATGGLGTAGLAARGTTALGKAAWTGLAGGLEGAAYGASQAINEDFLNDREITAERIMWGAGEGFALGGALSGGVSLLGSGLKAGAGKVSAGLGTAKKSIFGNADDLGAAVAANVDDAMAGVAGQIDELIPPTGQQAESPMLAGIADDVDGAVPGAAKPSTATATAEAASSAEANVEQKVMTELGFKSDSEIVAELSVGASSAEQREALSLVEQMGNQATASKDFRKLQESFITDVTNLGDEFARIKDNFKQYLNKGKKLAAFEDAMERDKTLSWNTQKAQRILDELDNIDSAANDLLSDVGVYQGPQRQTLIGVKEAVKDYKARFTGVKPDDLKPGELPKDVRKRLSKLNPIERELEEEAYFAGVAARPPARAPIMDARSPQEIASIVMDVDNLKTRLGSLANRAGKNSEVMTKAEYNIQKSYMRLRDMLEDEALIGKEAANFQRVTNAAESEAIRTGRVFRERFATAKSKQNEVAGEFKFGTLDDIDPDTIGAFSGKLGAATNIKAERDFILGLRRDADMIKIKAQYYRVPKEMLARAERVSQIADELTSRMRVVRETKAMADDYAEALANLRNVPVVGEQLAKLRLSTQNAASLLAKAEARSAAISASGASADAAALATTPQATRAMDEARAAAVRGESRLESAALKFISTVKSGASKTAKGVAKAARVTAKVGKVATVPIGSMVFRPADPRSYEQTIRHLQMLSDRESEERKKLSGKLEVLAAESPEHAAAIEDKVQRTADFLLEKAGPSGIDVTKPFGHLKPPAHDRAKAERLARYARAAQNPQAALQRVADGTASKEDAETVRELYPRLWARFGTKVRSQLTELKTRPTYQQRLRLSETLGQPMTSFETPQFQQAIADGNVAGAAAAQSEQAPEPKTVSPSRISTTQLQRGNRSTGSDQTLSRGQ